VLGKKKRETNSKSKRRRRERNQVKVGKKGTEGVQGGRGSCIHSGAESWERKTLVYEKKGWPKKILG